MPCAVYCTGHFLLFLNKEKPSDDKVLIAPKHCSSYRSEKNSFHLSGIADLQSQVLYPYLKVHRSCELLSTLSKKGGIFFSIASGFPTLIETRRSRKRHCLSAENSMAFAASEIHCFYWKLFQLFNHDFCTFVNISATEGDDNVTFFCICENIICNFLKGVEPDTSGNLLGKILCVNSVGVDLS